MKKSDLILKGEIVERLTTGSKIIYCKNNNFEWYIIIENPKDSKWRFELFETMNNRLNDNIPSLMVSYNRTKKQVFEIVDEELYNAKFLIEKQKNAKFFKEKQKNEAIETVIKLTGNIAKIESK